MPPLENIGDNIDKAADGVDKIVTVVNNKPLAALCAFLFAALIGYAYFSNKNYQKDKADWAQQLKDERAAHKADNDINQFKKDSLRNRTEYLDSVNAELIAGKYKSVLDLLHVNIDNGKIKISQ